MRKIKKILVGIITMVLLSNSTMVAFAEEAGDMNFAKGIFIGKQQPCQ